MGRRKLRASGEGLIVLIPDPFLFEFIVFTVLVVRLYFSSAYSVFWTSLFAYCMFGYHLHWHHAIYVVGLVCVQCTVHTQPVGFE